MNWRRRDVDGREKDEEAEHSGTGDPRALSRREELESAFPESPDIRTIPMCVISLSSFSLTHCQEIFTGGQWGRA